MERSYKPYAGIGSRKTPPEILQLMEEAARFLHDQGCILRSGGAKGADTAFEKGVPEGGAKEIYIPWPGFNDRYGGQPNVLGPRICDWINGEKIAAKFHPSWGYLEGYVRKFMVRNTYQVLGATCKSPALFVLCWTPGGHGGGGTGQAIRIAKYYDIPVFDYGAMSVPEIDSCIKLILETWEKENA